MGPPGRGHDPKLLGQRTQAPGLVFGVVLWGHGDGMSSGVGFWGVFWGTGGQDELGGGFLGCFLGTGGQDELGVLCNTPRKE